MSKLVLYIKVYFILVVLDFSHMRLFSGRRVNIDFSCRLDLEILKEAGGGAVITTSVSDVGGATEEVGGATLTQVKQLEQQNQRLHDTLVKYVKLLGY